MPHQVSQSQRPARRAALQPADVASQPDALLTLRTVSALSGMSEPTLYRRAKDDPTFPRMVRIGQRCTRIRAGDLIAWLQAQAKKAAA